MSAPTVPPADVATVEALRKLKAVEAEWDARLAEARRDADEAIGRAREETEAALRAVGAELEAERTRRLDGDRAAADREAEAIRQKGEQEAAGAAKAGRSPVRADAIVAAVLGPLAGE